MTGKHRQEVEEMKDSPRRSWWMPHRNLRTENQADGIRVLNWHPGTLSHETKIAAAVILLSFVIGRILTVVGATLGMDADFLRTLGLQPGDFLSTIFGTDQSLPLALCQWDCVWYERAWTHGYDYISTLRYQVWAFFPAFPLLVRIIAYALPLSPLETAYVLNNTCLLVTGWLLYRMVRSYRDHRTGLIAASLFLCSPFSLYLSVPYTEALFNLLSITAFTMAYRGSWLTAGLAMALLSATRPTGFLIAIPMLVIAAREIGLRQMFRVHENARIVLALALCPLGLCLFAAHLYALHGDALAFSNVQIAWSHVPRIPFERIFMGFFEDENNTPPPRTLYNAVVAVIALCMVGALAYIRRMPEAAFLGAIVLASTTMSLFAIARYSLAIWPTYVLLAILLRNRRTLCVVVVMLLPLLLVFYAMNWVNRTTWTI